MTINMPRGPSEAVVTNFLRRALAARLSEAVVTNFLRRALAARPMSVTDIDPKARAAGLLSEGQSITTAKVFKRAKKSLGITSRRIGFGAHSQWLWQMPNRSSRTSAPVEARPEPAPARRIPSDWLEGVARLHPDRPPNDVPRHRWRQFVDDCRTFLDSTQGWAERAARLGWDAMALFGCAPKRPLDYSGSAGLLWAINGGRFVELRRDWALIEVPVHRSQRVFSRRNMDAAKISLPWAKRAETQAI